MYSSSKNRYYRYFRLGFSKRSLDTSFFDWSNQNKKTIKLFCLIFIVNTPQKKYRRIIVHHHTFQNFLNIFRGDRRKYLDRVRKRGNTV